MWENGLSGATSEWLMSAQGGLGGNPATPGAQGWNLVASGDFNGDGITDLMWQNAATGATSEWLMSAAGGLAAIRRRRERWDGIWSRAEISTATASTI